MFYGVFHFFFFFFLYIYIYIYVKYSLSQSVGRLCATLYFEHSCIFFPSGFIFVTRKLEVQSVEFTSKGKVFPLQAQCGPEGGRGIALLFHDSGTRRGEWSAERPGRTLPPGKARYPLYSTGDWVSLWTGLDRGGKSRPYRDSIPDRPTRSSVAIPTELPGPHICIYYIYFYINN